MNSVEEVSSLPHNVSQIIAVDSGLFTEHVGRISGRILEEVLEGIDVVLDR